MELDMLLHAVFQFQLILKQDIEQDHILHLVLNIKMALAPVINMVLIQQNIVRIP